ncbi:MAG TPA: hypothetical protein VHX88_21610 [Solirubrobacteraceae bacterium]|nr:hypothetical protein [Solirubrobacteraceae bacterium]
MLALPAQAQAQAPPTQASFAGNPADPTEAVTADWTVPAGVSTATFTLTGGSGGSGGDIGGTGGGAGTLIATLPVTPGQVYEITVGGDGAGGASAASEEMVPGGAPGGPGGGRGGGGSFVAPFTVGGGGGGGGQSSVALLANTAIEPVLTAPGGGGGGGGDGLVLSGGAGGNAALPGAISPASGATGGGAGSAAAPGAAGTGGPDGINGVTGTQNNGGAATSPANAGGAGGGGGGAYGGGSGGGGVDGGAGGGGGGFLIVTRATNVTQSVTSGPPLVQIAYTPPPAPPPVSAIKPHPAITGTPALGQVLQCASGVPASTGASLSYHWLRDVVPLPGQTGPTYTVGPDDVGHYLQCQVTASDPAGSATATSAFVSIPVEGVGGTVTESRVGAARVSGHRILLPIFCSPQVAVSCEIDVKITAVETIVRGRIAAVTARVSGAGRRRAGRVTHRMLTLATLAKSFPPGAHREIAATLDRAGLRLLASRHRLPVRVQVQGTLVGALTSTLRVLTLTIKGRDR